MPRTRKPGPRENRTDLGPAASPGATQAPRVAPGGRYGSRQETLAAQRAVPLPDRSTAAMMAGAGAPSTDLSNAPAGGAPAPPPAAPQDAESMLAQFVAAAQGAPGPAPGGLLGAPGDPNTPLTSGMDIGSGPGSEVLMPVPGAQGPDPSIVLWFSALPALETLASLPGSSPQVRQFYRRIRSQLPPDYYATTEQ